MYGPPSPATNFDNFDDFPEGGGYPKGFLRWAYLQMGVDDPREVLHLCSGSVRSGITVDIRAETRPSIVADCRHVPYPDGSFRFILADPPYSRQYAANLYGTASVYPKPGQILKEASRLLSSGGRVGLLHFMEKMVPAYRLHRTDRVVRVIAPISTARLHIEQVKRALRTRKVPEDAERDAERPRPSGRR